MSLQTRLFSRWSLPLKTTFMVWCLFGYFIHAWNALFFAAVDPPAQPPTPTPPSVAPNPAQRPQRTPPSIVNFACAAKAVVQYLRSCTTPLGSRPTRGTAQPVPAQATTQAASVGGGGGGFSDDLSGLWLILFFASDILITQTFGILVFIKSLNIFYSSRNYSTCRGQWACGEKG